MTLICFIYKEAIVRILGVGHRVVDKALQQAKTSSACVATLPVDTLPQDLFIFRLNDRVTGTGGTVRAVIAEVELDPYNPQSGLLLPDWQLLERLNSITEGRGGRRTKASPGPENSGQVPEVAKRARALLEARLGQLDLPFKIPSIELWAILWPVATNLDDK